MFADGAPRRFPAWESDLRERSVHDEIYGERLRTLKQLQAWRASPAWRVPADPHPLDRVIVTSMQSLMQLVPERQTLQNCTRRLATGDAVDCEELREWLVRNHYHATTAVQLPGEFAARGGIVDRVRRRLGPTGADGAVG